MAIPWWKTALLYQIYVPSFADSNGDGVGDLSGVISRLDHLAWLGVDGIWLSPTTVSPNADWGYDVADYCAVQPAYGTVADLEHLVDESARRGMRVLLDLVPNHTSDQHPWFIDSRSSRTSRHRDWYVWADPKQDGTAPNNWVSSFGGPAWTLDPVTGQYYLHNFLPEQPDLNWWNDDVRDAFDEILRFWFDRGVAGFRIDVAHMIVKDAELRDNPPATKDDDWLVQIMGQRSVYNSNRPEVHDVLRRWRRLAESYDPPRLLVGETSVEELDVLATFYGTADDELNLAFNFPFINAPFQTDALRAVFETSVSLYPLGAWPVWTGSNHDVSRLATRWAEGDPAKAATALLMLLTLPGTPVLYQGDEIGLVDTVLTRQDLRDPVGIRYWPAYPGRDPARTPMPWKDGPGGGFTAPAATPWLPLGDVAVANVEAQRGDPTSVLAFCHDAIALRRATPDLTAGDYRSVPSPAGVWAWQRGSNVTVVLNLSDVEAVVDEQVGTISLSTDRTRDGEAVTDRLRVGAWEGLVLSVAEAPGQ